MCVCACILCMQVCMSVRMYRCMYVQMYLYRCMYVVCMPVYDNLLILHCCLSRRRESRSFRYTEPHGDIPVVGSCSDATHHAVVDILQRCCHQWLPTLARHKTGGSGLGGSRSHALPNSLLSCREARKPQNVLLSSTYVPTGFKCRLKVVRGRPIYLCGRGMNLNPSAIETIHYYL